MVGRVGNSYRPHNVDYLLFCLFAYLLFCSFEVEEEEEYARTVERVSEIAL